MPESMPENTSDELITIHVNGQPLSVRPGTTVAAALLNAQNTSFRRSVTGQKRAPLCGMGVCFECRVTVDGQPHQRSCLTLCHDGMEILTDA